MGHGANLQNFSRSLPHLFSFAAGAFDAKHTQFGEIEKSQARSRLQNVSREEPALLTNDLRFEDLELNSD
jgi:hypothetical protein